MSRYSLSRRFAVLLVVALALSASGEKPKPRVMVILDTSRSMREKPSFATPSDIDIQIPVDPAQKGDFDPSLGNDCDSKFCAAKKVIYSVIPQYTGDARIGITTYYQYVLNAKKNDTQSTSCFYDVLGPPGVLRTFTSTVDFTGSGTTTCPGGPTDPGCPVSTRVFTFPDRTASGSGDGLNSRCNAPGDYTQITDPALQGDSCAPGGLNCYEVTKTLATPGTTVACSIGTFPVPALPRAYGASSCATATTYSSVSTVTPPTIVGGVTSLRTFVNTSATTCSGTPTVPNLNPSAADVAATITSITTGTGSAVGTTYTNGNTLSCSTGAPCSLFLHSSTPQSTNTARHWYGFFNNGFSPNSAYTGPNTYPLSAQTGAAAYSATVLTGSITIAGTATCPGSTRAISGNLTAYGIVNPMTTLNASVVARPAGSTDNSPTVAGSTFNCTPDWPCDVTLGTPVMIDGGVSNLGIIYNTSGITSPQYTTALTADTVTLRMTNAQTSCPGAGSINSDGTAPSGTLWTTAPGGCGAGNLACSFTSGTSGVATAPGGTCNSPLVINDGTTPANCSFNGKAYSGGTTTSVPVTREMAYGSTCTGGTFTIASLTGYTGCSTAPCTLTAASPLQTAGSLEYSAWQSSLTVPSGYSGTPAKQNRGGQTYGTLSASVTGSCGGAAQITSSSATICGGATPCLADVLGYQKVSDSGCGSENAACYACVYQPVEYRWSRNKVMCNYTAPARTWTVDRTALTCNYSRARFRLWEPNPPQQVCPYTVGARRYDFNQPNQKWCEYWAIRTTVESPRATYTYQYLTKGTEIIGRGSKETTGATLCSTAYGGTFATQCPTVVNDCTGITPLTSGITMGITSGSRCKLQYGGGTSTSTISKRNGRYSTYASSSVGWDLARSCEEDPALPASTDLYKSRAGSPMGFCSESGSPAVMSRYLVSDWFDPTQSNSLSAWDTIFPPSTYTVTWNNSNEKRQGFGGKEQLPATSGSGAVPHSSIFVPIPSDAVYDSSAQQQAIKDAVSKCIMPGTTAPGGDGRLAGGACVSDMQNPSAPGATTAVCSSGTCSNNSLKSCTTHNECWPWQDFTPLYGSLKNTYDYLLDRWTNDDGTSCRDYFIVLATDGAENTPKGYAINGTDATTTVQGLISSFRDTSGSKPDVKTFVIAFGENIGSLDNLASAGGTNQAFTAASQSELETALSAVFTSITQGTYSRSRPALSTDGTRLYAAQYIKPEISASNLAPDWSGMLTSYRVASDGTFSPAWEHGAKLNDSSHPARTIRVGLRQESWPKDLVVGDFIASNAELWDQLNDGPDWDDGCGSCTPSRPSMDKNDLIAFIRGAGVKYYEKSNSRSSALGPIVMSAPVVVGKSPYDVAWGGSTTAQTDAYTAFVADTETRPVRVLFQANDAMLHAVIEHETTTECSSLGESDPTCVNGREDWAFIPGSLYSGYRGGWGQLRSVERLAALYKGSWSEALLDNTLAVSDVCGVGSDFSADGCDDKSEWKTIAIGTQRAGGRGVYAVDVTANQVPNTSRLLWDFWDDDLGFTYSVPAIGRVKEGGKDHFVAVFGGGMDDDETGSMYSPDREGNRIFVVHAVSGTLLKVFSKFDRGASEYDVSDDVLARPATWRRPNQPYMDSAYIGVGQSLYTLRFAKADGTQHDSDNKWKPEEFFDPTSTRNNKKSSLTDIEVRRVVVDVPGTTTTPPKYKLEYVKNLPLLGSEAPPIMNRPKMGAILVPGGALPDLFVGTGDVASPTDPSLPYQNGNYFYAVHDGNEQLKGSRNDGVPMWVAKFDGKEQVVSEPAIISGCIVVATYTPPAIGSVCGAAGDTTLYGFAPLTGELTSCLTYPAGSQYAGSSTPVVKMAGTGIPSDLVVVNDNVYLSTSQGGLQRAPVRQMPRAGNVRSFRRIK